MDSFSDKGDTKRLVSLIQGSSAGDDKTRKKPEYVFVDKDKWLAMTEAVVQLLKTQKTISEEVPIKIDTAIRNENINEKIVKAIKPIEDKMFPNLISIFGIFASIATFLLAEIQLFRGLCDFYQVIGLSFFLGFVLLVFLGLLLTFYSGVNNSKTNTTVFIVGMICMMVIGGWMISQSPNLGKQCRIEDANINNLGGSND